MSAGNELCMGGSFLPLFLGFPGLPGNNSLLSGHHVFVSNSGVAPPDGALPLIRLKGKTKTRPKALPCCAGFPQAKR